MASIGRTPPSLKKSCAAPDTLARVHPLPPVTAPPPTRPGRSPPPQGDGPPRRTAERRAAPSASSRRHGPHVDPAKFYHSHGLGTRSPDPRRPHTNGMFTLSTTRRAAETQPSSRKGAHAGSRIGDFSTRPGRAGNAAGIAPLRRCRRNRRSGTDPWAARSGGLFRRGVEDVGALSTGRPIRPRRYAAAQTAAGCRDDYRRTNAWTEKARTSSLSPRLLTLAARPKPTARAALVQFERGMLNSNGRGSSAARTSALQ